ncbi:MOSC domain-containing protein [Deinococcus sp.]|uniref:MOSC domain-containing protein n=1 Tax=Deinococcus sp. TaxID=47478 RepID=UPI0025DA06AF|nr:MOSC domain-containing protein [Deinococcus sp.]
MLTLHELRTNLPRPGRVDWLGLRTVRRGPVEAVEQVEALPLLGLVGDHGKREAPRLKAITGEPGDIARLPSSPPLPGGPSFPPGGPGKRQVTLIQAEHFPVMAALAGLQTVTPDLLRRNIVVSGISLRALGDRRFWVGGVLLEGTGECHPCSRMEENLGPGGYNAVRGHGGLTARVLGGGVIRLGDTVRPAD